MSFGENLQYLRDHAEYTQESLAERLEVSRQSVSKWESGGSFPEMEKIMLLCELFHVDMDTLLRGDVKHSLVEDRAGYDKHYGWFSKMIAGATVLILLGISAMLMMVSVGVSEAVATAFFLLVVAVAVVLYIVAGMTHGAFQKKHPVIADFYSDEEKERQHRKSVILIASGVTAIVLGIAWLMLFGDSLDQSETISLRMISIFMFIVAGAVGALIYGGIQSEKCDVSKWNKEHDPDPDQVALRHKINTVCGVIMLLATAIFLAIGFGTMALNGGFEAGGREALRSGWSWGWIVFPIAAIFCGIADTIIRRNDPEYKG